MKRSTIERPAKLPDLDPLGVFILILNHVCYIARQATIEEFYKRLFEDNQQTLGMILNNLYV